MAGRFDTTTSDTTTSQGRFGAEVAPVAEQGRFSTDPTVAVDKAVSSLPEPKQTKVGGFLSDIGSTIGNAFGVVKNALAPAPKDSMVFKVGEGLTPEQAQKANDIITSKGYTPIGQDIKLPFIQAGITVPKDEPGLGSGVGTGYSFLKGIVEAPERLLRSFGQAVGVVDPAGQ